MNTVHYKIIRLLHSAILLHFLFVTFINNWCLCCVWERADLSNGRESRTFKSVLAFHFVKEEFLCFCLGMNFKLAIQTVSGRFLLLHIPTLSKCVLLCKLLMGYIESNSDSIIKYILFAKLSDG